MFSLLRRRPEFRRLFLAHTVSRAGDAFNTVALVVLVFRLTGSGRGVATTVAFEVAPVLLFGPVAGVVADRFPRRRVMIAADLVRAAVVFVLVVWHDTTTTAFAVAFGLSTAAMLFNPAAASLVPDVVEDDELVAANSALWITAVASQIVLAPLAGAIIAAFGVGIAFAVNAASYLVSAAFLSRMRAGRTPADIAVAGWRSARDGIAAVRSHPLLARLAVVQVLASLSAGATSGLLVVLAADTLEVGASGFGLLLAAIGVGAVVGPALLRRWIRPSQRRWLFGPYAVRGVVDLVLAATRSPLVAGSALGAYGASTSTGMIAYQSTLQTEIPDRLRGRAFALFDVLWNAARLVSLGLGGLVADAVGIRAVYIVGGLLLLVAAGYGASATPSKPSPEHELPTRMCDLADQDSLDLPVHWKAYGRPVQIQILYVPECPNLAAARSRVQEALRDAGLHAVVEEIEVASFEDADRLGMHGSPTILVDGHDPFAPEDEASLSCRLYRSEAGTGGSPTVAQLTAVLSQ